eukprot:TRINITY_DN843_c0_g1_i1.p1 TRINITY_DN843_c0_g1~~TRINITY_DN843_c0_g1_i1.p1  ORF type:complete len:239 (-),score=31.68 TRINITY_DN843_c0_g1_i1:27-743(-)
MLSVLRVVGSVLRKSGRAIDKAGSLLQPSYVQPEKLSTHRRILGLGKLPHIGDFTFIAPNATVVGGPSIGQNGSVGYGAVIRSDIVGSVTIGDSVSIGDRTVIHDISSGSKTSVGDNVFIGSNSVISGCKLESESFIDAGCVVLEGAVVGKQSRLAPGTYVPANTSIPPKQLWAGSPAKYVRDLTDVEIAESQETLVHQLRLSEHHDDWHHLTPQQRWEVQVQSLGKKDEGWKPESLF